MTHHDLIPHFTRNFKDPGELYRACKEFDNYPGEGSYTLAALRAIKFYWLPLRQFFYEPLNSREQLKYIADVRYALEEAYVPRYKLDDISLSFRCFESAYKASKGRLNLPKIGEAEIAGHSVAMSGWDYSDESILFINSWGTKWGDNGYGAMPPEYFDKYLIDAWLGRNARYGLTLEKYQRNKTSLNNKEFAREWSLENPRWSKPFLHNKRRHQWVLYEALSATGCAAEIIDIRNGFGLRLGWAHLFHLCGDEEERKTSVLKELFVYPSFRRHGYGTLLESMAAYRAGIWRSQKIQIPFHDIDSFLNVRAAGRIFAEHRGYNWKWRVSSRPNISGIAERMLH